MNPNIANAGLNPAEAVVAAWLAFACGLALRTAAVSASSGTVRCFVFVFDVRRVLELAFLIAIVAMLQQTKNDTLTNETRSRQLRSHPSKRPPYRTGFGSSSFVRRSIQYATRPRISCRATLLTVGGLSIGSKIGQALTSIP